MLTCLKADGVNIFCHTDFSFATQFLPSEKANIHLYISRYKDNDFLYDLWHVFWTAIVLNFGVFLLHILCSLLDFGKCLLMRFFYIFTVWQVEYYNVSISTVFFYTVKCKCKFPEKAMSFNYCFILMFWILFLLKF